MLKNSSWTDSETEIKTNTSLFEICNTGMANNYYPTENKFSPFGTGVNCIQNQVSDMILK